MGKNVFQQYGERERIDISMINGYNEIRSLEIRGSFITWEKFREKATPFAFAPRYTR